MGIDLSEIFISHAGTDKQLIRPILDRLIEDRHRLWFDRPRDLGYTEAEIDRSFNRLVIGDRYGHKLFRAIDDCDCTLLLASEAILSKECHFLRREVAYSYQSEKLIVAKIRKIDLEHQLLREWISPELAFHQCTNLSRFFSSDSREFTDCLDGQRALDALAAEIRTYLGFKSQHQTRRIRGAFQNRAQNGVLSSDETDGLLAMIGREPEAASVCLSSVAFVTATANPSAKPSALATRLAAIDLPIRYEKQAEHRDSAAAGLIEKRTRHLTIQSEHWQLCYAEWPQISSGKEHKRSDFLAHKYALATQLFAKSAPHLEMPPDLTPEDCLLFLLSQLQSHSPILFWTRFYDQAEERARNESLIRMLISVFSSIHPSSARLLVAVEPAKTSLLRRPKQTYSWLSSLASEPSQYSPLSLGPLQQEELREWWLLAARVFSAGESEMENIAVQTFEESGKTKLPFRAVELSVRRKLSEFNVNLHNSNLAEPGT